MLSSTLQSQSVALLLLFPPSFRDLSHETFLPFFQADLAEKDNFAQYWRRNLKSYSGGKSVILRHVCQHILQWLHSREPYMYGWRTVKSAVFSVLYLLKETVTLQSTFDTIGWIKFTNTPKTSCCWPILSLSRTPHSSLACTLPKAPIERPGNHLSLFQQKTALQWYCLLSTKSQTSKSSLVSHI